LLFHGRTIHPAHFAHPWVYPPGYAYRMWVLHAILPPLFWSSPTYYYSEWAELGLTPPPPGFQWVQYGPDLLLVNVSTGEVVDAAYGVFY
jgi:Ni/Co efflux regulator RcnB